MRRSQGLAAYLAWLREQALPAWAERGFDRAGGRFRERLDGRGDALAVPHRSMVQARQIYVFAHGALLGWFPEGAALAERAMASLLRDFCDEGERQASFAFSIDLSGRIVSPLRDTYAHAFMLFALAWLHRLNGDPKLLALADKVIAFIDAELTDPVHGGLFDASPAADRTKRQNPVMHLLEAYLFLEHAAPGRGYLERAGGLVRLFETRLFEPEAGVLLEYFAEDWSPCPDPARADVFEPGHHFEWVWLLAEHAKLAGTVPSPTAARLYEVAAAHGFAADGLIHDELAADRRVLKPSHRVWPHTEAIKAGVARGRAGDAHAAAMAERMGGVLLDRFLDRPFAGGWVDHIDQSGQALVDYVPASSLYHLFFAGAEASQL